MSENEPAAPAGLVSRTGAGQEYGQMRSTDAHGAVLETLLLEAIETAQMAICVYDERGRYVTVNDCACKILGYSRDELLYHDVADFTKGGIDRNVLRSAEQREGVR